MNGNSSTMIGRLFKYSAVSITLVFCIYILMSFTPGNNNSLLSDNEEFPQNYRIISPKIPDNLHFAGETIPVENFDVYERLDRELLVNTYWHSATVLYMKRAQRWFSVIEPILKKNGIPDDFKYLAVTESGLDNVISPAGAVGFWQFLKSTGEKYGLEINGEVDERYNVIKSTEAACKYLLEAYEKFGTWTLAAASYNRGMNGIERQIERQKSKNYYNLVLTEETSRYIFRMVALKDIMNNPRNYGFNLNEKDLYPALETYELEINSGIENLADFAIQKGINYATLKLFNPWLRDNFLTNKNKKRYTLLMPEKGTVNIIQE